LLQTIFVVLPNEKVVERLGSKFPKERIYRSRASPVIGTHTGPGLLVVTVLGDK
jgi:fatty acid-binding protein DegV